MQIQFRPAERCLGVYQINCTVMTMILHLMLCAHTHTVKYTDMHEYLPPTSIFIVCLSCNLTQGLRSSKNLNVDAFDDALANTFEGTCL